MSYTTVWRPDLKKKETSKDLAIYRCCTKDYSLNTYGYYLNRGLFFTFIIPYEPITYHPTGCQYTKRVA